MIDSQNFIVIKITEKEKSSKKRLVGIMCWRQNKADADLLFVASVCDKFGYAFERQMICWLAIAASYSLTACLNYEEELENRIYDLKMLGFKEVKMEKRGSQMFWERCTPMRLDLLKINHNSQAFLFLCKMEKITQAKKIKTIFDQYDTMFKEMFEDFDPDDLEENIYNQQWGIGEIQDQTTRLSDKLEMVKNTS